MQSSSSIIVTSSDCATSSSSPSELTAKDGLLIASEIHLALFPDEDGDTSLHLAVLQEDFKSCEKITKLLHLTGKSLDVHNNLLQTPLHIAVITNQRDMVKLLVEHGANPNAPDRYGSTSIHLCAKYDSADSLVEILQSCKKFKLQLNLRDYEGRSAVHVAVISGAVMTLKVLVTHGADIDARDNKGGRTPLVYAIEHNNKTMVELLLERDASVSQQTYSGDTALHIASGRGLQDIVRLLLRRGADATAKFNPDLSPLLADPYSESDRGQRGQFPDSPCATLFRGDPMYPIAPEFLKMAQGRLALPSRSLSHTGDLYDKRPDKRKLKMEFRGVESDIAVPPKKVPAKSPIFIRHPLKEEIHSPTFLKSPEKYPNDHVLSAKDPTRLSDSAPINLKLSEQGRDSEATDLSQESVAAIEEVVMSQVSSSDSEERSMTEEEREREKLRQESRAMLFPSLKHPAEIQKIKTEQLGETVLQPTPLNSVRTARSTQTGPVTKPDNRGRVALGKAVVVRHTHQLESATALTSESDYLATSSKGSPPSRGPSRASSKPASPSTVPNPTEVNLYQLAREGLAVAAMANSARTQQILRHDINVTPSPKLMPSRQAKIKSGTEQLQHLALQGLAVAAMNSQVQASKEQDAGPSSQATSQMTQNLSKFLSSKLPNIPWPPEFHRSNSLPPYLGRLHAEPPPPTPPKVGTNDTLLALAHANARKDNVGQAVSAIPMVHRQGQAPVAHLTPAPENHLQGTGHHETPESTRQNLRQAIINRNAELAGEAQSIRLRDMQKIHVSTDIHATIRSVPTSPNSVPAQLKAVPAPPNAMPAPMKVVAAPQNTMPAPFKAVAVPPDAIPSLKSAAMPQNTTPTTLKGLAAPQNAMPMQAVLQNVASPQAVTVPANATQAPQNSPPPTSSSPPNQPESPKPSTPRNLVPIKIIQKAGKGPFFAAKVPKRSVNPLTAVVHHSTHIPDPNAMATTGPETQPSTVIVSAVPPAQQKEPPMTRPQTPPQHLPQEHNTRKLDNVQMVPTTPIQAMPKEPESPARSSVEANLSRPASRAQTPAQARQTQQVPPGEVVTHSESATSVLEPQHLSTKAPPQAEASVSVKHPTSGHQYEHAQGLSPMQHTVAYVPCGGGYMPVLLALGQSPIGALPHMYPWHPLPAQDPLRRDEKSQGAAEQLAAQLRPQSHAAVPSLDALSRISTQAGSLLSQVSPAYASLMQQYAEAQHKEQSKEVAQQQQVKATQRPVAAVSAFTPRHNQGTSQPAAEDQPLNLSQKREQQPLNLKKPKPLHTENEQNQRHSSVIKVAAPANQAAPQPTRAVPREMLRQNSEPSALGNQVNPSILLPPPLVFPRAMPQPLQTAAFPSVPLPPIHYVNGMPFILPFPPPSM